MKKIQEALKGDSILKRNLSLLECYGVLIDSTNKNIKNSCTELRLLFFSQLISAIKIDNTEQLNFLDLEVITEDKNKIDHSLLLALIEDCHRAHDFSSPYEIKFRIGSAVIANTVLAKFFGVKQCQEAEIEKAQTIVEAINYNWNELAFLMLSERGDKNFLLRLEFK